MIDVANNCLELWQHLIHAIGGELELTNSCYSMMTWKLEQRKEKNYNIYKALGSLTMISEKYSGMKKDLCRNEVQKAERRMDTRLTLSRKQDTEYKYRLDQSKALSGKISCSLFSRYATEVIYQ